MKQKPQSTCEIKLYPSFN